MFVRHSNRGAPKDISVWSFIRDKQFVSCLLGWELVWLRRYLLSSVSLPVLLLRFCWNALAAVSNGERVILVGRTFVIDQHPPLIYLLVKFQFLQHVRISRLRFICTSTPVTAKALHRNHDRLPSMACQATSRGTD